MSKRKRADRRRLARLNRLRTGYFFGTSRSWFTRDAPVNEDMLWAYINGTGKHLYCIKFRRSNPAHLTLLWCFDAGPATQCFDMTKYYTTNVAVSPKFRAHINRMRADNERNAVPA